MNAYREFKLPMALIQNLSLRPLGHRRWFLCSVTIVNYLVELSSAARLCAALDFVLHPAKQVAQADVQPAGDVPEGFDVGVVLPALDLRQMRAGDGGEAGQHLLGHAALQAQPADDPPGDGVVVAMRHKHHSF